MYTKDHREDELRELIERFIEPDEAQRCVDDIRHGEDVLREYPAPEPSVDLISAIKGQAAVQLQHKTYRKTTYRVAEVAAAVIFLALIWAGLLGERGGSEVMAASIIPAAVWESDNVSTADMNLAILTAKIEQIEEEIITLESDESGKTSSTAMAELEMELAEINSDFWKGQEE